MGDITGAHIIGWQCSFISESATGREQMDYIYIYENGLRIHATVRQINRCTNRTLTKVNGTKGYADVSDKITT